MGIYCWGEAMPPEEVQALVWHADNTLLDAGSISFNSAPLHTDVLGAVSMGQRPTGTVRINDATGWFLERLDETWLTMGAGTFITVRGLWTQPILTGTVLELTFSDDSVEITYGDGERT
jgi:hypothetical protein